MAEWLDQPEVTQLRKILTTKKDVRRLHIAMEEPRCMTNGKALEHVSGPQDREIRPHPTSVADPVSRGPEGS
jgi:hypothetical protein